MIHNLLLAKSNDLNVFIYISVFKKFENNDESIKVTISKDGATAPLHDGCTLYFWWVKINILWFLSFRENIFCLRRISTNNMILLIYLVESSGVEQVKLWNLSFTWKKLLPLHRKESYYTIFLDRNFFIDFDNFSFG